MSIRSSGLPTDQRVARQGWLEPAGDVWEIIASVRAWMLTLPHAVPAGHGSVQAAISYYGAYRDEIDLWIESNEQQLSEAYASWSAGQDAVRQ